MKRDLVRYIAGEKNAIRDEFIISRENCGVNELVYVRHPEVPEPIYEFWAARKKKRGWKPKHTGGKKPYVMLMIEELATLIASGTPAESIGYLICLVPYVEWGTGRLLIGRYKRQMRVADVEKVFQKSHRHTFRILSELKKYGLLECGKEGYFVSRGLIKKGGATVANQV